MKTTLLLLSLLLALGCSASDRMEESAPKASQFSVPSDVRFKESEASPSPPSRHVTARAGIMERVQPRAVDVYLDTGSKPLAAYTIELRFDPQVVAVLDVTPPGRGGFPGTPMVEPTSFAKGVTRIVGLHTGANMPRGRVRVARILFRPAASAGSSSLSVSVLGLYGPGGTPIHGQAVLSHHRVIILGSD